MSKSISLNMHDHHWASRTGRLIRRAQAVLNDVELTLGLPATQPSLPGFQKRHYTRREGRRQPAGKGARG